MSRHHENVVWQSPDGTWNIGFHPESHISCDSDCDDDTHEWCREFDSSEFFWVSAGHTTPEQAMAAWVGANPGSHTVTSYDPARPQRVEEIAQYEDMAAECCERAQRDAAEARSKGRQGSVYGNGRTHSITSPGYWGYRGPAKQRTLKAVQTEMNEITGQWVRYRLGGYANVVDESRRKVLNDRVKAMRKTASVDELEAYEERQAAFLAKVEETLAGHRQKRAKAARYGGGGYTNQYNAVQERDARERDVEELIESMRRNAKGRAAQIAEKKASTKPGPAKKPTAKKTAAKPTARGKTTAKSTAGSFKAPVKPEATGVDLDVDHLWD